MKENVCLRKYVDMAELLCPLDMETVSHNISILEDGFADGEGVLSLRDMSFVAANLPVFLALLALDTSGIRASFRKAVSREAALDGATEQERTEARSVTRACGRPEPGHAMELGYTVFTDEILDGFCRTCDDRFAIVQRKRLWRDAERAARRLSGKAREDVRYVLSNFAYLLRALCNNNDFWYEADTRVKLACQSNGIPQV